MKSSRPTTEERATETMRKAIHKFLSVMETIPVDTSIESQGAMIKRRLEELR